jgi:hypothetical protein
MRIRWFRAFASNNSGAYVLLGRFRDLAVAEASARELNEALAAHDAWASALAPATGTSPFMTFAEKHGLPMQHGRVPWEEGMRCEVLGQQVLLESYAAEMPSAFVAWIAKHGGHVETEIIHAHGATVLRAAMHTHEGWRPENRLASVAARTRVVERARAHPDVVDVLAPRRPEEPLRRLHAVPDGAPSTLLLAPRDVTRATKAIRAIALEEEVSVSFSISEWIDDHADPAAVMAGAIRTEWLDVVLASPGPDPEALIEALAAELKRERRYVESLVLDRPLRHTGQPAPWPRHIVRGATAGWAERVLAVALACGASAHLEESATRPL